jgi:hypothetical protein
MTKALYFLVFSSDKGWLDGWNEEPEWTEDRKRAWRMNKSKAELKVEQLQKLGIVAKIVHIAS